jgi:hypothetical protein
LLFAIRVGALLEAYLHDDALLAHLHDHVERVFFWVVEHFDQCDEVGVVQLLHDGNLFLDQLKGIVFLCRRVSMERRVEAYAGWQGAHPFARGWAAEEIGLGAFAKSRLGELLDSLRHVSSAKAIAYQPGYPHRCVWRMCVCHGQRCVESWCPHIFLTVLVDGEVDSSKGAATNLLLDQVLVDAVLGAAVILAVAVLGARIERFLRPVRLSTGMSCWWCQGKGVYRHLHQAYDVMEGRFGRPWALPSDGTQLGEGGTP